VNFNFEARWHQNGLLHRVDGPAVEYADGEKEWWIDGEEFFPDSFEDFKRIVALAQLYKVED